MSDHLEWLEPIEQKITLLSKRLSAPNEWELFVRADQVFELLKILKTLPAGAFNHLADLSAYDESPKEPRFHVFYELISMENARRTRVVAVLDSKESPHIRSVVDLWKGADWLEREVYDMYGIVFDEHPDLRRILLPPSFKGFPLRKDFVVDYRQEFVETSSDTEVFDPFGSTVVKEGDLG